MSSFNRIIMAGNLTRDPNSFLRAKAYAAWVLLQIGNFAINKVAK
jgi:hypothetical protein